MKTPKGVVAVYEASIPVQCPSEYGTFRRVQYWMNVAHGYKDGNVNHYDKTGELVDINPDDTAVSDAASVMRRTSYLKGYVYVTKDGEKIFSTDKLSRSWVKDLHGCYKRRSKKDK